MLKTAVVTGASRGIGKAVAETLAADGYTVIVNYSASREKAEKIASDINGEAFQADVSDRKQTEKMFTYVYEKYGHIDLLVNNAGISVYGLFNDISEEDENRIIDVNIRGMLNCSRKALEYMIKRKYGRIINISSMWGETGASCEVHYSMTKAAVIGFTKALAKEVGMSGIQVNCVSPGMILTDMTSGFSVDEIQAIKDETPLYTIGVPQNVADAVSFLASHKADFITGQVISVNGGFVI